MVQATDEPICSGNSIHQNLNHLKPQCENCFGLCCVALYFSKADGFPTDKSAGTPCPNLTADFRCAVHEKLESSGLNGCAAYECFGAGQQVSQVTFAGMDWRSKPSAAGLMFDVFLIMQQLHEMCWYLNEALAFKLELPVQREIRRALRETEQITQSDPHSLIEFDLLAHRAKIGALLGNAGRLMRSEINRAGSIAIRAEKKRKMPADYFGKDLRKKDLRCADLRGACLIAADLENADLTGTDFLGADFRDANLKGANLSASIFLTQSQINVARGDSNTALPLFISRPKHWS